MRQMPERPECCLDCLQNDKQNTPANHAAASRSQCDPASVPDPPYFLVGLPYFLVGPRYFLVGTPYFLVGPC